MNVKEIIELSDSYRAMERKIVALAKQKLFEKHDAAHKSRQPGANDPRYLASHLEFQYFEEVFGDLEVTFHYIGSLSGADVIYLRDDDLRDI